MWQPGVKLAQVEKETILKALQFYHGNRTHTADSLGISVRTMVNKITEYKKQGAVIPEPLFGLPKKEKE